MSHLGKSNYGALRAFATDASNTSGFLSNVPDANPVPNSSAGDGNTSAADNAATAQVVTVEGSRADGLAMRARQFLATSGGVVAGMFQNIGDSVIGAGQLLNTAAQAQAYMALGGDNDLNRSMPGFSDRQAAFQSAVSAGQAVGTIAQDPSRYLGDALNNAIGQTFDNIQAKYNTANASGDLSDYFLYGAAVGNATMSVVTLADGIYGAGRVAASGLGSLGKLVSQVEFAPSSGRLGLPAKQAGALVPKSQYPSLSRQGFEALEDTATGSAASEISAGPLRGADGRFVTSEAGPSVFNRKTQYPSGYRSEVVDSVLDANTITEGPNAGKILTADGEIISRDDPRITIEHNYSVVDHWNEIGYDTSRGVRNDFFNDVENMSVRLRSANSSDGGIMSSQGIRYRQDVGPNYTR